MLDDAKSQALYRALKSSGGLSSPAGQKADTAISDATSYAAQLRELATIPKEGMPPGGGLPVIVPSEVKAAAAKLEKYGVGLDGTISVSKGLRGAIDQRMDDVTGKMAIMGVAGGVAQKMGEVDGGCGPLGQAFSVITSTSSTDNLIDRLSQLPILMGPLAEVLAQAKRVNAASLPKELREALAAAMTALDGPMAAIHAATSQIDGLVSEAQAMWGNLEGIFKQAVETSVLLSALKNPCLMGIADAVMPQEAKDVLDQFS